MTRRRPGSYVGFRAPDDLKKALQIQAKRNGRSLSAEVQAQLEAALTLGAVMFRLDAIEASLRQLRLMGRAR